LKKEAAEHTGSRQWSTLLFCYAEEKNVAIGEEDRGASRGMRKGVLHRWHRSQRGEDLAHGGEERKKAVIHMLWNGKKRKFYQGRERKYQFSTPHSISGGAEGGIRGIGKKEESTRPPLIGSNLYHYYRSFREGEGKKQQLREGGKKEGGRTRWPRS